MDSGFLGLLLLGISGFDVRELPEVAPRTQHIADRTRCNSCESAHFDNLDIASKYCIGAQHNLACSR
jgi:hypothetical protein